MHLGGTVLEAGPRGPGRTPGRPGCGGSAVPAWPALAHFPGSLLHHTPSGSPGGPEALGLLHGQAPGKAGAPVGEGAPLPASRPVRASGRWGRGAGAGDKSSAPATGQASGQRPSLQALPGLAAAGPQPGQGPTYRAAPSTHEEAACSASGPVTIPRPLDRGRRTSGAAALGPLSLPMGLAGRRRERGGGSSGTGRGLISIGSPDPRAAPAPLWAWPGSGSLCLWWPGSRPQHSGVAEIPTPRHSKGKEGTASPHRAHGETGGEGAGSPGRRAWGRPCCVRMAAPARQRERHPQSLRARGCRGPQPGWGSAPMGSGTGRTLGALVPCGSSFPAPVRGGGQDTAPSSGKGLGSLEPGGEEPGPPGNRAVGGASALPRPPSPGLEAGRF